MFSVAHHLALLATVVTTSLATTQPFIDLTYAFNNATISWPGRKSTFSVEIEGFTPEGLWVASKGFCTSEHTATHIDAPYHVHKTGRKLHEIPLEDLIDRPGVMIDIYDKVHKVGKDGGLSVIENYVLTREDVMEWERKNGRIPQSAIVLLRTGWGSRWPDRKLYLGLKDNTQNNDNGTLKLSGLGLNFPGFDASAATYLGVERGVLGVGIDSISIDPGNSKVFPAHQIFGARNIWMLEMVANLHLLPPKGFNLWVVPFKIDGGTGAPTRVIARIEKTEK